MILSPPRLPQQTRQTTRSRKIWNFVDQIDWPRFRNRLDRVRSVNDNETLCVTMRAVPWAIALGPFGAKAALGLALKGRKAKAWGIALARLDFVNSSLQLLPFLIVNRDRENEKPGVYAPRLAESLIVYHFYLPLPP